MNRTSGYRTGLGALALGCLLLAGGLPPAAANGEDTSADGIAAMIDQVAAADVTVPTATLGGDAVVASGDQVITVPAEGSGEIVIESQAGITVPIGLPSDVADASHRVAEDGTVYYDAADSVDVAVQVLEDAVRIITILDDATAPTEYEYSFGEFTPRLNADGSATLTYVGSGFTAEMGQIEAPWAVDRNGTPVPTSYSVSGNSIIQVVDHTSGDYAYPIIADPQYGYGWAFYVFFNRAETATIATMGWGVAVLSAACGYAGQVVLGPAGAAAGVAACAIVSGTIVYQAGVAQNSSPKRCLRLAFPWALQPIPNAATYLDSRCR